MPSEPPEEDNHCSFDEDGQRCGAFRIRDSAFCNAHAGGLIVANERRTAKAKRVREMNDELDLEYFHTRTRKEVAELTEKIINHVIKGTIKRDKAAPLAVFLPFAYKMAKDLEGTIPLGTGMTIKVTEKEQSLSLQMDEATMDKYLSSPESVRIQILEELQASGKVQITKQKGSNVIDVVATDITAADVKIPARDLADLTSHTDIPLSTKQVRKLFGRTLQDTEGVKTQKGPEMLGFGHVFDRRGLPEGSAHNWIGAYEPAEVGGVESLILWFTCSQCKKRQPNVSHEEVCPQK